MTAAITPVHRGGRSTALPASHPAPDLQMSMIPALPMEDFAGDRGVLRVPHLEVAEHQLAISKPVLSSPTIAPQPP